MLVAKSKGGNWAPVKLMSFSVAVIININNAYCCNATTHNDNIFLFAFHRLTFNIERTKQNFFLIIESRRIKESYVRGKYQALVLKTG